MGINSAHALLPPKKVKHVSIYVYTVYTVCIVYYVYILYSVLCIIHGNKQAAKIINKVNDRHNVK